MQKTAISWTSLTWNPASGCSKVSDGCKHCYAATLSAKYGWTEKPWTIQNEDENVVLKPHKLHEPYKQTEKARCFVNSMSDLFHRVIPDWYRAAVFAVMLDTPYITYQILTKRPELAETWHERFHDAMHTPEYQQLMNEIKDKRVAAALRNALLVSDEARLSPWADNIWMGASVEDARVLHRLDSLRRNQAKTRFVSAEPLLGPWGPDADLTGIHWVIVGGESGTHMKDKDDPRWMKQEWAREIRDLCVAQGTAFFYKQDSGYKTELRPYLVEEDGSQWKWMQFPGDLVPPTNVATGEIWPGWTGESVAAVDLVHSITVLTARVDCTDPDALDITAKSAKTPEGEALAPTWEMVNAYKSGLVSDGPYADRYIALLRRRYRDDPTPFLSILERERVVLTCYCAVGEFCHRHLAVDVLEKIAISRRIGFERGGEWQKPAPVAPAVQPRLF
jgi:protein gp37